MGVLVSSYFMMSKDGSPRLPVAFQPQNQRIEASTIEPAVQSLFDIEKALRAFPKSKAGEQKRMPSFSKRSAE